MKLLFGIYGRNAKKYLEQVKLLMPRLDIITDNCLILNACDGPITVPAMIRAHGKTLLLNGTLIWRDHTLDEYFADPVQLLGNLLQKQTEQIPREFVNGAFNGVVIENDALWLFNDFFALDPLYYMWQNETLIFSSRLRLLNQLLHCPWDSESIREYLALGYNFSYKTVLSGIQALPPASLLRIKNGQLSVSTYASFPEKAESSDSQKNIVENVRNEFSKTIKRIYSPRMKYSLGLTGGMDTRLLYFEWPGRSTLMTETAGKDTSDHLKAQALVEKLGNPDLYKLEDLKEGQYTDGIRRFYEMCDNPTKLLADFNYYHLLWKKERGAHFHLSGAAAGELLNGESLYLSRRPWHVAKEALLPYSYHRVTNDSKRNLIANVLYSNYKHELLNMLEESGQTDLGDFAEKAKSRLDKFLGQPAFSETYTERFRTLWVANFHFYPLSVASQEESDFILMPYNDRDLMNCVTRYHPRSRELRRLELALLKTYDLARDIPLDTSHLRLTAPYFAHKFMRTMRMVLNIGLHKKVPFIQKGEAPKFRAFKYFDQSATDFREYIRKSIKQSSFFDKKKLKTYLSRIDQVEKFNFYTNHREAANLMLLFRLAQMERTD